MYRVVSKMGYHGGVYNLVKKKGGVFKGREADGKQQNYELG